MYDYTKHMNQAAISADIVSFTALSEMDRKMLWGIVGEELKRIERDFKEDVSLGRLVSGDQIEIALKRPLKSLRIALILKTRVKFFETKGEPVEKSRAKYFNERGLRIAIGVGFLLNVSKKTGMIDGDAIYMSGRKLKSHSTAGKGKIFIKDTLFFCSKDPKLNEKYELIFSFIDTLIARCSTKQSEVLYYRLLNFSETDISQKLDKSQSTISRHAKLAGWNVIEKALNVFEGDFA